MPMEKGNSRKGMKICCGVTAIVLIIFVVVSIALFFTVLKPKNPHVIAHPTTLENVAIQIIPKVAINATLGLVVTIENPNYGSFRFKNSTAYISYHDNIVAEVPIESAIVPSRGKINVTTYANITGDKLVASPFFMKDLSSGHLELISETTMHGKVRVWEIIKFHARVFSSCNISVSVLTRDVESKCHSLIKL